MRKVRNFFTGRLFPTLLLLLLFAAAFAFFALRLPVALAPFAAAERLFSFGVGVWVANEDNLSENKTAKLLLLLLLPYTGAVLCLCMKKRRTGDAAPPIETTADSAEYFSEGADAFVRLLDDLKGAQTSIYLEFYIIAQGVLWQSVLAVLKEKAKAGVDVRVIYDDFGCALTMPRRYPKTLEKAGIRCRVFRPVRLSRRASLRDHRKIAVIDGRIGYTGGLNLADEYVNLESPYGHWKDSAVRLEGEGVKPLIVMFLTLYNMQRRSTEDFSAYIPERYERFEGEGYVQPYGDGPRPMYARQIGEDVYINLLNAAKGYVYIATPYLIIDYRMREALVMAAERGVDVRIITPHVPDKKIAFSLTRSNYMALIKGGVKIYEYTPGFIHSKIFLCDGEAGVVGTINLDYRSLMHHYENAVLMYKTKALEGVKADMDATFAKSKLQTEEDAKKNVVWRLLCEIAKVFAPLF